ncbi:MAG TPA: MFS transporter [Aggregatilineaceae bacterium]|nr:MFS transporter [Aggregatilineaceae bacterium]
MERLPLPSKILRPLGYPRVADLPEHQQKGLRGFWLDGLFASLANGFTDPYYSLYMLSLHATNAQIGLVNTLNQLAAACLALPGATIADRTGRYKQMALFAGVISRLMWIVMLTAPLFRGQTSVTIVLCAWVAIAGMGALGNAAWTALSADLVPPRLRGGYFASRNMVIQFVSLLAIPTAGFLVNILGEPEGYQVNLLFALAFGVGSIYFYNQIPEHAAPQQTDRFGTLQALRRMTKLPHFMRFTAAHTVLMLGAMIGSPFINVFMAEERHFSVGVIGLVTTIGGLFTFLSMRAMGRFHDRFGITATMRFGLGIPLVIALWALVSKPWHAYVVNAFGGFAWAGYNLGSFNLLLVTTPDEHRPRYIALYTTIVSIVSAIGPIIGAWSLQSVSFQTVFLISGGVRCVGLLLFFMLVREPDSSPPDPQ